MKDQIKQIAEEIRHAIRVNDCLQSNGEFITQKHDIDSIIAILSKHLTGEPEVIIESAEPVYTHPQIEVKDESKAIEAIGWTWAEACAMLNRGEDPRHYNMAGLLDRAVEDGLLKPIEVKDENNS